MKYFKEDVDEARLASYSRHSETQISYYSEMISLGSEARFRDCEHWAKKYGAISNHNAGMAFILAQEVLDEG